MGQLKTQAQTMIRKPGNPASGREPIWTRDNGFNCCPPIKDTPLPLATGHWLLTASDNRRNSKQHQLLSILVLDGMFYPITSIWLNFHLAQLCAHTLGSRYQGKLIFDGLFLEWEQSPFLLLSDIQFWISKKYRGSIVNEKKILNILNSLLLLMKYPPIQLFPY